MIQNNGQINIASRGAITTSGKVINNRIIDSVSGTITNSGLFYAYGELTLSGTITNGPTDAIQILSV